MMAAVSRHRRFIIFLVVCCITYLLFSWYIKTNDSQNNAVEYISETIKASVSFAKSKEEEERQMEEEDQLDYEDGTKPASFYDDTLAITEETTSKHSKDNSFLNTIDSKPIDTKDDMIRLKKLKQSKNKPSNLFSFNSAVTIDFESLPSGPTDDDSLYMEAFIQKAGTTESMSQVTEAYQIDPYKKPKSKPKPYSVSTGKNRAMTKVNTDPNHRPDSNVIPELKSVKYESTTFSNSLQVTRPPKNPALILDTSGCKIPKMDPFDPTVVDLIEIKDPYVCSKNQIFMTPEPNGIIHLNTTVLKKYYNATPDDMHCWYQAIIRKHEEPGHVRENDYKVSEVTELMFDKPMDDEYIAAKCFFKNNHTHEQYLPLVKLKKEIEKERSKIKPPSPLNVILLGIDSISKLNYMRHFRQTKAFLRDKLKPFDMKGYTKVGDNTFPNLVPLLTGHFVEYYWNESIRDTYVFDNIDLIWKDYAKKGFRTFYAEDSPYTGTFNYLKRGFHDPPTDYYYRPLALAIENSELRKQFKGTYCLNSQMETDLIYDYLINFVKTMDTRPYIAFAMVSTITHDILNEASYADPPAARVLEELDKSGALNRSALVIFSDHGLRFGAIRHTYVGKFEERMPFMYIHFPEWFLDQHPDIRRNLKINQNRLMTLFDIHATMKHLLHLNGEPMEETDEIGLSLLNEIPENRTCNDAFIFQHWCPCNSFDPVPVNDSTVAIVSKALISHINELLLPHKDVCEKLEVGEVTDARLGLPNIVVRKFLRHDNVVVNRTVVLGDEPPMLGDYLLTLTAKPGGAIFEGTVRYDAENKISKVFGISRINMYRNTSWCINSQKLKIYCYCKKQQS